jgi:two-component system cell cycle response regulator DivK
MTPTVLLVDDNEVNRYLAQYVLEQAGMRVYAAANGNEAMYLARTYRPSVVLMDIQMPVLDGYAATEALKADPDLRAIPVVALTTFADDGDRLRAMSAGCIGHIAKPIDPVKFVDQVRAVLAPAH